MRVITFIALCLTLTLSTAYAQIQPETISVETMPAAGPNWFISKTGEGAYIFDASSGEMHGLLSLSGYQAPGVEPYAARKEFYAAESYYSRRNRGDRTDVVTVYDFDNLAAVAEIEIPKKMAILSFRGHLRLTNNGKHLGVFNMTPAQSVSIVDVENRTFVGEISTPGCAIIMPVADNDFLMLCGDGTLQLIQLDDAGKESNRIRSSKFFDVQVDPVYDHPVETATGWLLLSHQGKAFNISQSGNQIQVSEPWSILTDEDIEDEWLPGGHQLKTVHKGLGLLYVLMHKGDEYTHHERGTEIWMFDIDAQRRIGRIELEQPAGNIMVTQESSPLLVVAGEEGDAGLLIYDPISMKLERAIEDAGPGTDLLVDF
jgi:methylamine dehydrogenase heavy chain